MASKKHTTENANVAKKKKKITKRQQQKRKLIIFGIEIVCLLVLLGLLYVWSLWSKIEVDTGFDNSEAGINEDLDKETLETLEGYTNIALFGLDNRSQGEYDHGQSDVIMIASINNKTKEVRLVSVYRDTYLSIGDGKFSKANSAYARGGAKQAVQMLNANLDLDITEYACVDWAAVTEAIDALGGVEIEITDEEVRHINSYLWEIDEVLGTSTEYLTKGGKQVLTGTQATTYARIRKTAGADFKRTSRQRIVLEAMLNKAKTANLSTLLNICNAVFDDISTSLTLDEIIALVKDVQKYNIGTTTGFPFEMTGSQLSGAGDAIVPIGLEDDVAQLHEYLFDTKDYKPSKTVQAISNAIIQKTGVTEGTPSYNVDSFNDTAGQSGTVFKDPEDTEKED
ncbi:MAG: LCP family protein [Agathobacter sp.]|nr:LCP family protein [Agathobacter sp.]